MRRLLHCAAAALGTVLARSDEVVTAVTAAVTERLEARLMATEDELWAKIATRTGVVLAELASARAAIEEKDAALAAAQAALADVDTTVAQRVADALALDTQRDLVRLEEHARALGVDLPVDVPTLPVPDAGAPAPLPPDAPIEPVDEESLPV